MFASLYEPQKSAHLAYLKTVKLLQDQLGADNDRAIGLALISAHSDLVPADGLDCLAEQLWTEKSIGPAAAQKTLDSALRLERFWLD